MNLYTRHQLFKTAFFSIIAGALIATLAIVFVSKKTNSNKEQITETSTAAVQLTEQEIPEEDSPVEPAPAEQPKVTKTAASSSQYTQDEEQNIYVYEKCNEAVVNMVS